MFIGGTNFGFMNSLHIETTYDFDAPMTEYGDYGDKYWKAIEKISVKI